MSTVTGTVTAVKEFVVGSGKTMYSIQVNGALYGCGSYRPKCSEGDIVSFDYTMRGEYKNVEGRTLKVTGKASVEAVQAAVKQYPAAADNRQTVISKQAALNSAMAFVELLTKHDAVPGIGKTTKQEDKYQILDSLVLEKMGEFYAMNTGEELDTTAEKPKATAPKDGAWA